MNERVAGVLLAIGVLAGCSQVEREPEKAAAETIYVSDERGNAVIALDARTGTILKRLDAGRRPRGMQLSPDGKLLYVAISGSPIGGPGIDEAALPPPDRAADGIAAIDLSTGKRIAVLFAGADPETFVASLDGKTLFVSNEDLGTVSAVATQGSAPGRSASVGDEPEGIALSRDGERLFVASEASDTVTMLDARTLKVLAVAPLKGRPRTVVGSRDGRHMYVTLESGGKLAVLSAVDASLVRLVDFSGNVDGARPMGIAEAPDGHLFISTGRNGGLIEVDPASGSFVRSIAGVGERPWGIAITGDGSTVVTANGPSGDVSFVDRQSGKVIRQIKVGVSPWGIAIAAPAPTN